MTTTPTTLSPGQCRLREYVTAAAANIDPNAFWDDPPTVKLLGALRARALADPVITGDPKIGRDLAVPSVPATYVQVQKLRFPGVRVPSVRVAVEHLLFDGLDLGDSPIAVAGATKWSTTYGALIHFAHGRAVKIGGEAAPSLLRGSSVIAVGTGSNHRTLASFLWGDATLEHPSELMVIEDERDGELWRACEHLEVACSRDLRRSGLLLPDDDGAEIRARLAALGEIAARDTRFRAALEARSRRPPPHPGLLDIPTLDELEMLAASHAPTPNHPAQPPASA
jgi:hypothetical protein